MYKIVMPDLNGGVSLNLTSSKMDRKTGKLRTSFCSVGSPVKFETKILAEAYLEFICVANNMDKDVHKLKVEGVGYGVQ